MKKLLTSGIIHGRRDRVIRSQLPNNLVEDIRLRAKLDRVRAARKRGQKLSGSS